MPMRGFAELNARFKSAMDSLETSRTQGVIMAVVTQVKVEAASLTPIDTSNLFNSAYSRVWRTSSGWMGAVGYGAEYAEWVHNMSGKLKGLPRMDFGKTRAGATFGGGTARGGTYWSPDAEPQFLAKAVDLVITQDLPAIIETQYRI